MKIWGRHLILWGTFLLPVWIFIPGLTSFIFIRGASYNDLAISHYPIALTIQRAWQECGQIPLWSDAILSGFPIAANPLSSLFYPPHWLALLLPLPLGLNLTAVIHLVFGGMGMYRLLRSEGVRWEAALLGGLAFEAMPKLSAHFGAGHLTLVYAVAWTPWLLLAERMGHEGPFRRRLLPGVVLGMIMLADVRWALPATIGWVGYRFLRLGKLERRWLAQWVGWTLVNFISAVAIAASLIVPLFEYTRLSTRSIMTAADVLTYSLPFERFFGLVIPDVGSLAEWVLYPGAIVLGAVILSLRISSVRKQVIFWLGLALFGWVYALGESIPGMSWIAQIPVFNLVRVPSRMIFLSGMGTAACLGWLAHVLMEEPGWGRKMGRWNPMLLMFAVTGMVLVLGTAIGLSGAEFPWRFVWGGISLAAALTWIGYGLKYSVSTGWAGVGIAILACDLIGANALGIDYRPGQEIVQGSLVAEVLGDLVTTGDTRVYSPSYSIPQQTAVYYGFDLADGIDPLQLRSYQEFMEKATGVAVRGYSVTMPPFGNGDPKTANRTAIPDAGLLGKLNVGWITSEYDLTIEGLTLTDQLGNTRIYRNNLVLPRVGMQATDETKELSSGTARIFSRSPNRWVIKAQGPGLLVVREIVYPGWKFRVDNIDQAVVVVDGLMRGVQLESGEHEVVMEFQPVTVYTGIFISLVTILLLGGLWIKRGL